MKQPKPYCPNCKGTDLDTWPDGYKFGYCYTCHESVTVVYPTNESHESTVDEIKRYRSEYAEQGNE